MPARKAVWKKHGIGTKLEIGGQKIPITVRRPTLQIEREQGTNLRLHAVEEGGTQRLVVGRAGLQPTSERQRLLAEWNRRSPEERFGSPEYWNLFSLHERMQERKYWEHMIPKDVREKDARYWPTVPWEERHRMDAFTGFEKARAEAQRAGLKEQASVERLARLKEREKDLEKELRTPWSQREKNVGAGNIVLRGIRIGLDFVMLPAGIGSFVLGLAGKPINWLSHLFGRPKPPIPPIPKGTTLKGLVPAVFEERRELAGVRRQIRKLEAEKGK